MDLENLNVAEIKVEEYFPNIQIKQELDGVKTNSEETEDVKKDVIQIENMNDVKIEKVKDDTNSMIPSVDNDLCVLVFEVFASDNVIKNVNIGKNDESIYVEAINPDGSDEVIVLATEDVHFTFKEDTSSCETFNAINSDVNSYNDLLDEDVVRSSSKNSSKEKNNVGILLKSNDGSNTSIISSNNMSNEDYDTYSVKDIFKEEQNSREISPLSISAKKCAYKRGKHLCPFCYQEIGNFARHLFRRHSDDETIRKISKMSVSSAERRRALVTLRKKGNFLLNKERHKLRPVRMPKKLNEEEYVPCNTCLGYYKSKYLWRHKKLCLVRDVTTTSRKNHLTEAQTFMAATGPLGCYLSNSRLKADVFSLMRPDRISFAAKSDPLICLYGESFLKKYNSKQMNVVSNKIREIARLKLTLQDWTTVTYMMDVLIPEMYDRIVAAAKIITGYDTETKTFKATTLALNMGTNLKFLCDVAAKAVEKEHPLFSQLNREVGAVRKKQILELKTMIECQWCNDMFGSTNKVGLMKKQEEKPKLVALVEDIQAFHNYVTALADNAFEKLRRGNDIVTNYELLTDCTLCLLLVFNGGKIGEIQFLNTETYKNSFFNVNREEHWSTLSALERITSGNLKRVIVYGNHCEPISILFTRRMQKFVDLLLETRTNACVPETNKYVFAYSDSKDEWVSSAAVLRKFAYKCGAKNPALLIGTRFKKQITTILQLMSFERDEMELVARFMGHTEKTYKEFYRLREDVWETAKVAKVLLLLNSGKGNEFKGKNLSEIQIDEEIISSDVESDGNVTNIAERVIEQTTAETTNRQSVMEDKQTFVASDNQSTVEKQLEIRLEQKMSFDKTIKTKQGYRVRWGDEKKIVLNYFKKHIKTRTPPKKIECLSLIRQYSHIFKESEWVRIKTLVYNTYRDK